MSKNELPQMVSYFDEDVRVSLEMPIFWNAGKNADFPLLLVAPKKEDYHSNLGFERVQFAIESPQAFEASIRQTKADQARDYEGYEMVGEERWLQDNRPTYWQQYTWSDGHHLFVQVLVLFVLDDQTVMQVHGATLVGMVDEVIPIFRHVIESLRFA